MARCFRMHVDWHALWRYIAVLTVAAAPLVFLAPQVNAYYTNMPATVVVGQPDFQANAVNQGGNASANTLADPYDAIVVNGKLMISDNVNHRVLIFNTVPTQNNASADVVIGQANMNSKSINQGGSANRNANTLNSPQSIYSDGKRLFIADGGNNRVLIFNSIPTTNNASADVVVGQPDFTSGSSNQGGTVGRNTLSSAIDVWVDGSKLLIADNGNHRVLIFNSVPTTNNAFADVVIGQPNFSSNSPNQGNAMPSANTLWFPSGIFTYNGKLFITELNTGGNGNKRLLIFDSIPTSNNASANVVLFQPDFSSNLPNQGGSAKSNTIVGTRFPWVDNGRLFVPEDQPSGNNRLLIFNSIPTTNNASADIVLGQSDFTSSLANQGGSPQSNTLNRPTGGFTDGSKLIVADRINNRILIFDDSLPSVALSRSITGQPDGLLRFSGSASTGDLNQHVIRIEYSVNGSTWNGAFPGDGKFDSPTEDWYFDFDPFINTMADNQGYTLKIRSTHDNDIDTSKAALYFQPFLTNAPANNSFTLNRLPAFTFTIQKQRFSDLKENLDHFRVMVKREGGEWQPYVDFIPVDYHAVRLHPDNLRPNQVDTMNGTYEDKFKTVTYDQENSVITVQAKAVDSQGNASDQYWENGGRFLSNATYQWKVQAEDHAEQLQETEPQTLRIGTRQVVTSRPFFPLAIYAISGIPGYMDISTSHPDDIPQTLDMTAPTDNFAPTFAGIATAGSMVSVTIIDAGQSTASACLSVPALPCSATFQTTAKPDSSFRITVPKAFRPGNTYEVTASVKDTGDNYNELPTFTVQVRSM